MTLAPALAALLLGANAPAPSNASAPQASKTPPAAQAPKPDDLPPLPTGPLFPYKTRVEKLPNGLTVVMVPFQASGLVAYDTLMRVGSRNEVEKGRTGYAHFFEHMMFRGTKKNPEEKYNGELRRLGVDSNAFTTDDFTLYHNLGSTEALPELIDLEADRFQNLAYAQPAFQTEAKAVLGEYNKDASQPDLELDESLHKTAFVAHTYRHTTIGFLDDVKRMPGGYAYSKQFFKRYYTPDNAIIFVAGDFKPDEVLALVTHAYGGWKGKAADPRPKAEPPQNAERRAQVAWSSATLPRLLIAYHTPADVSSTQDAAIQNLLAPLLIGPTSALYKSLVLDEQIVDHMESWYADHRDPNLFTVAITAKSEAALPAIQRAFDQAVSDLGAGKLDERTLRALKLNQIYSTLDGLETAGAVAMQLAMEAGPTGDPGGLEALLGQMVKVTPRDVTGFSQRYLQPSNRTVVTLRSKGGAQ